MIAFFLAALLALPAVAQQGEFRSDCFLGLNDADSPATLSPCESPDLLNVESNLQGTAAKKRKGFQKTQDLTVSTAPVTGSHTFIDTSGNRQDIVCSDRQCAHSVNGNAFANFLTTATAGVTRWSWVDVGGVAYGGNSQHDPILKYDGTTLSYPNTMPRGAILEMAQSRLVVGDILGSPNRVYYSSAGYYEGFTTGANTYDAYFDDLGAPGDKIRGLKYINGNLYIFKSNSLTLCELGDQYSSRCSIISPSVGTTDPASIVAAGDVLYFRAQDKNYWELGPQGLRQISKKIPNLIKSQSGGLGGGENSNTQTTQADWIAGNQAPPSSWDYTTTNGSIFPSSQTFVNASSAAFNAGTHGATGAAPPGYLIAAGIPRALDVDYVANVLPESAPSAWTKTTKGNGTVALGAGLLTLKVTGGSPCPNNGNELRYSKTLSLGTTMNHLIVFYASGTFSALTGGGVVSFRDSGQSVFSAGYSPASIPLTTTPSTFTVVISSYGTYGIWSNRVFQSSGTMGYTPTTIVMAAYNRSDVSGNCSGNGNLTLSFAKFSSNVADVAPMLAAGQDIPLTSTFTSAIFNAGVSTEVVGPFHSTATVNGGSNQFQIRSSTSPNNDMWTGWAVIADNGISTQTLQYVQYRTLITPSVDLTSGTTISGASIATASTGTFRTQCIQPNSSISAWGALNCAQTLTGGGSEVLYATSAATCSTLPTTRPDSWQTSVTNNATLSIATNTAVYIGWRSLLTSATDQAQVDSCILNWNEGTPAQPAWAAYDSVKNAIYWTTTINGAPSSNRLLKYDRNLEQWYPFDIPAQAPRMINNKLYFGGASSGTWNLYGEVDSDAGNAINAYWKSKDIGSDSPFNGKTFRNLSILARNNGSGSMTGTWTLSNAQTGSFNISLSTGTGINYVRKNYLLPLASSQQFLNFQFGNNSSTPFEVLGLGATWSVAPWTVEGP